ncbi:hypothetical protein K1719_046576 [Acacia pycnantha]|nr:hypothetical protein K1719_046576 [Acacia pycnantha]
MQILHGVWMNLRRFLNLGKIRRACFPVFCDGVDPSDVRYQRKSFGKALAKHEKRFIKSKDKVQKWRDALSQVSNFSGWDSRSRNETEVIQDIVEAIWNIVCSNLPSYDDNLVGIEARMVQINSLLEINADNIRYVGIWGMGGDFKRKGLARLQNDILLHFNKGQKIHDEHYGKTVLNRLFQNRRVLLVLDDVNHVNQLENLACPKWFGVGSRVIITTRNLHLLKSQGVHRIYEAKPMEKGESLELFSKKAFKKDYPEDDYLVLSEAVVKYTGGIPLALYVLGSLLCGRSLLEWEETLERMTQIPEEDIFQILKECCFQESPGHVLRQSRLWNLKDIDEVLKNDKGSEEYRLLLCLLT